MSQKPLLNGNGANGKLDYHTAKVGTKKEKEIQELNRKLKYSGNRYSSFHGDALIGDVRVPTGWFANLQNKIDTFKHVLTFKNLPAVAVVAKGMLAGKGLDPKNGAQLVGSMPNNSNIRRGMVEKGVADKYDRMLHPPLTYLGDAFQYRTVDGKFNSVLHPHLGQAGAPYAKSVPSKTHPLGALPDPGDLFDRLMARDNPNNPIEAERPGRNSHSGLSSMLIYHATIIIHDIFRTNDNDKNISDSSSYLDLSPLYGYTEEMQRKVRDDKYMLGLLKPDTFAEDRLLRQPPGVCIYLVMYNRYHNYAATQLRRINENGRFTVPTKYDDVRLVAVAKNFVAPEDQKKKHFQKACEEYRTLWEEHKATGKESDEFKHAKDDLKSIIKKAVHPKGSENAGKHYTKEERKAFKKLYDAAWKKLDDDLFNTARLITCGIYIQISIHDYLRALMGFHQFNTNFTLDPRIDMDHKNVSRGLGNQVTIEFNLLYRFHCAISQKDEKYTEEFMRQAFGKDKTWDPKEQTLSSFLQDMGTAKARAAQGPKREPWQEEFGLPGAPFKRNGITGLFNDKDMIESLLKSMDDPISNFGPKNTPKCLKAVEIMGIMQARKWEIGTLNDFRGFFKMKRHDTFESITPDPEIQEALRDLYEHPDKVELFPGVFCESLAGLNADPGPSGLDSALWQAIFSDAITLVRSDRFYTVDWNTNSLTSWGMKEVTPDNDVLKSSVFHRLLQRSFPEWFPYNSIRFFHPFYTKDTNAKYAQEQGYGDVFRKDNTGKGYDAAASKPLKPLILSKRSEVKALLKDTSDKIVHPARLEVSYLPQKIAEVLAPGLSQPSLKDTAIKENPEALKDYFTGLVRDIVYRESVTMNKGKPLAKPPTDPTYQIDITRDFAIPVVTRYVVDFLGFGDQVQSEWNRNARYTENEIYQHITNCQTFLSANTDETKLLKRRNAFKTSMEVLFKLTQGGNMYEANRWPLTRLLFGKRRYNAMIELGFQTAAAVLKNEGDAGRAAAILLLVALDSAYNAVLVFTSVLNLYIRDLYKRANPNPKDPLEEGDWGNWLEIQKLALEEAPENMDTLTSMVIAAQKKSLNLPVIRKATGTVVIPKIKDANGKVRKIEAGETIICDIHRAEQEKPTAFGKNDSLTYRSSFTQDFAAYHPKRIAILGLTSMVKGVAELKNLRRGHDAQGELKRINIDASYEGYSNYMAPLRMKEIEHVLLEARQNNDSAKLDAVSQVFTQDVLKPSFDTFLTPEWDELVPFPSTWKLRFDGFGDSTYGGADLPLLKQRKYTPDFPPFYQAQGPSHVGGTFAGICNQEDDEEKKKHGAAKGHTTAEHTHAVTTGCGSIGHK